MDDQSAFLFACCQRGAETALKAEMASVSPDFRPAFSRPGFITFKSSGAINPRNLLPRPLTFARTYGMSLGKLRGNSLQDLVGELWSHPTLGEHLQSRRFRDLHIWQRDTNSPGQHGFEPGPTPLAGAIERAIVELAPAGLKIESHAAGAPRATPRNRNVIDVALVEPGEWWIGWHQVHTPQQAWPGGVMPLRLPPHAVSRAYLKIEEALQWSSFPLRPGDEWVELGCAPGGACQALLEREQFVTGIDPAEVDPSLLEQPRFRHLQKRSAEVRRSEFRDVNWLAADINGAPSYTLDAVEAIVTHPSAAIRGLVLTLKLSDWGLAAELPGYLDRIRGWGYRDVRARQFAFNGQEVGVVALKTRAMRRLARGAKRKRRSPRHLRRDTPHSNPPRPHV